jgi:hypothetical protein
MSSEVSKLMQHIDDEWQAAFYGLYGLAQGTAQHDFIKARYDRLNELQNQLAEHVGEDQAMQYVIKSMERQ